MRENLRFSSQMLNCVIGGLSPIDLPRLEVQNWEEAREFALTYGYDFKDSADVEEIWHLHQAAVSILRDRLLDEGEEIPDLLADPDKLKDPANLLILSSTREHRDNHIQRWSCAILRVMHVLAHLENDLFALFSPEIQDQILKPIQSRITRDPVGGQVLGLNTDSEQIPLKKIEIKPAKSYSSAAIKLLAKPETVSMGLLDKVGLRFVTRDIFDAFRVVRFFINEHIISFPNIVATQVRNNLYPTNLFCEVMDELLETAPSQSREEINKLLDEHLAKSLARAEFVEKANEYSGSNYRAMKFIVRRLIEVKLGDRMVHFFFPYEIQVMDYETHLKNLSGPEAHESYKKRQKYAARRRVVGFLQQKENEA